VLQATGTDTVSGINLWMPQLSPLTETQMLNNEERGMLHGERVKGATKTLNYIYIYI
jgi:hypothetical protein